MPWRRHRQVQRRGTLQLSGGSLASTGALTVNTGGSFDLNGRNVTIGSLSGDGLVTNAGINAPATLTTNGDTTFSGVIQDGTSTTGLTKAGTGTLTLTGNNTYSGATTM